MKKSFKKKPRKKKQLEVDLVIEEAKSSFHHEQYSAKEKKPVCTDWNVSWNDWELHRSEIEWADE